MASTPTLHWSVHHWIGVSAPVYKPSFLNELKALSSVKVYDGKTKTWWFPAPLKSKLEELCSKHYGTIVLPDEPCGKGAKPDTTAFEAEIGRLKSEVDAERTKAGYWERQFRAAQAASTFRTAFGGNNGTTRSSPDYDTLGLSPNCSDTVLKAAWKAMAFDLHPDRNNGNDEAFKRCSAAYDRIKSARGL